MYVLSRRFNIFKDVNCDLEDTFNDVDKFLVKRGRNKDISGVFFNSIINYISDFF